jgi:hypothetical protein
LVKVFWNDGTGAFPTFGQFLGQDYANHVVLGDLNGDSSPDLIVTRHLASSLSAWMNNFGPSTAPVVAIASPPDGSLYDEGTVISFEGTATDARQGDLTDDLEWSSDLDGPLGTGGSIATTLNPGTHTVEASVIDASGLGGSDSIMVTVDPNTAPVVVITAPPNRSVFDEGALIEFAGSASDIQDGELGGSLVWSSDLDGEIGTGETFMIDTLTPGTHTIEASVADSLGLEGSDSTVVIIDPNTAPVVNITAPLDGSVFVEGEEISFEGTATDAQDGDLAGSLQWSSDLDGPIGSGPSIATTTLTVGTHTIEASVGDSLGLEGSDSIGLTVEPLCLDEVYCTTSPNSVGAGALINWSGTLNIDHNLFALTVNEATPDQFGLFFYGSGQQATPYGDGVVCVAGSLFRLNPPAITDDDGDLNRTINFPDLPTGSGPGEITSGSTWHFQFWYRDPQGPGGSGFNFSDALRVRFCP